MKLKKGDKVKVVCETPFNCENDHGKVRHSRKIGDICEVIFIEGYNPVEEIVFTKDKYEKISLDEDRGQYINTCDLELIEE